MHWATKTKARIKESFKGEEFVAIEIKEVVLISCYISPRVSLNEFTEILKEIERNIRLIGNGKQIILGRDFNAHLTMWGSTYTSCKGDRLLSWTEENMILVNEGNSPTCVRPQGKSIVDLTWTKPGIVDKIKEWKVEDEMLSLSDHNYITFKLGRIMEDRSNTGTKRKTDKNKSTRWKMETLDQELFDQILEWKCSEGMEEEDVEKEAEWIHKIMMEAADASMQRAKRGNN